MTDVLLTKPIHQPFVDAESMRKALQRAQKVLVDALEDAPTVQHRALGTREEPNGDVWSSQDELLADVWAAMERENKAPSTGEIVAFQYGVVDIVLRFGPTLAVSGHVKGEPKRAEVLTSAVLRAFES